MEFWFSNHAKRTINYSRNYSKYESRVIFVVVEILIISVIYIKNTVSVDLLFHSIRSVRMIGKK